MSHSFSKLGYTIKISDKDFLCEGCERCKLSLSAKYCHHCGCEKRLFILLPDEIYDEFNVVCCDDSIYFMITEECYNQMNKININKDEKSLRKYIQLIKELINKDVTEDEFFLYLQQPYA